ncbi:uncharacterized protein A4U43_C06F3050 [Asparagus officinalis]|uniref:F-box domain-containing protein n=1 Tax=Asparagus officinalis TaxID=4686 RepID=A0A5P1EPM5_ASPOF|nr:uncharacterized protein A4U43_C06F3050 [Asparagus officinalis]
MSATSKEENLEKLRPWSHLPLDIMDSIARYSSIGDIIRLGSVCKSWRPISDSVGSQVKSWPKLMYLLCSEGRFKLFDPLEEKIDDADDGVNVNGFLGLSFSKDGWVVATDDSSCMFIMNMFVDSEIVELPFPLDLPNYSFDGVTFSYVPTSSDFMMLGISGTLMRESLVHICLWRNGEWTSKFHESILPFLVGCSNPVFHGGVLYFLGREGNLGVFHPEEETWTVLDKPKPLFLRRRNMNQPHDCYLVESAKNKELMSVFVFNEGKRVTVWRLDKSRMAWRNVQDLGDEMIFVDVKSSISVVSPSKGTANRIYLPRFSYDTTSERGGGVYYSLKTKKLHTYSGHHDVPAMADCVWVMPTF